MIPVKLTIQGLYSYQTRQSIDFLKLTQAHIFGIFGPVGSGKSSILEAITFALFGRTERLNLSGDNRNYNMMNLKSNELFIEFIFTSGKDNAEYMAVVKGRRNSKQYDEVKALDRTAYKKEGIDWVPIEVDELQNTVGLNYDNFKRTIIIPQGKFQEFLQLGVKDRTQMMKELFNLEKYELFFKVTSLENKNNQQRQNIEGQLQQLGDITPEHLKEKEENLRVLELTIEQLSLKFLNWQKEAEEMNQLQNLKHQAEEIKKAIERYKEEDEDVKRLERKVNEYEYCFVRFDNLLKNYSESLSKIHRFELLVKEDSSLQSNVSGDVKECEIELEKIKSDYESKDLLKQMYDELTKASQLLNLINEAQKLKDRILNGEKIAENARQTLQELKLRREKILSDVRTLKDACPDITVLSQVREWYTVDSLLLSTQKDLEKEIDLHRADLSAIFGEIAELQEKHSFLENGSELTDGSGFATCISNLNQRKEELKAHLEHSNEDLKQILLQSKFEEFASGLKDGVPCPLCGSTSHPLILSTENIAVALGRVQEQCGFFEKEILQLDETHRKFTELVNHHQFKEDALRKLLLKREEHMQKTEAHRQCFIWNEYKEEQLVRQGFKDLEIQLAQIKEKENELESVNKKLEEEFNKSEKYREALEILKHKLTSNTSEYTTLTSQMELVKMQDLATETVETILVKKEMFKKKYTEVETNFHAITAKMVSLRSELDTITGRIEANKVTLAREISDKEKLHERIQQLLSVSAFSSVKEIETILLQNIDIEKERKTISEFRQSFDFAQRKLIDLNLQIGGRTYDNSLHESLLSSIMNLSEELKTKNQQQGGLKSEVSSLKLNLEKQGELLETKSGLEARAENIRILKQLFKSNGFVNYISSIYLQELCYSANERFYKLTRQKLRLEMTEDNNFQVRDFMNGGKLRSIKTLSGGQTFQAALSLALALADNIQKFSESHQNFFFLDEGFGSLDKESLSIVFDTLKLLRKENRIVGVISHVEEMQHEIDSFIEVSNTEDMGSIIHLNF